MKKEYYNLAVGILIVFLVVLTLLIIFLDQRKIPEKNTGEITLEGFEVCVNKTDLILYGRYNSQVFIAQQEELGDLFSLIPFVDCLNQRRECEGVLLIPAWKINGKLYYGSFPTDILIKLMGCEQ